MDKNIEELTLLLMYLTSWQLKNDLEYDYKNSWKTYPFEVIDTLTEKGYLFPTRHRNKSVILTKEGEKLAEELCKKYLKHDE